MKAYVKLLLMGSIAALSACAGKDGWKVEGSVEGAQGRKLAIEQNVSGSWIVLDSIAVDNEGKFAFTADSAAAYPDLYRLSLDGRKLYFPVDSLDHISINTNADDFGGRYSMKGSTAALKIAGADSLIYASINAKGLDKALADSTLKIQLYELIIADPEVMTAYYLISRNFDGKALFDINSRKLDYNILRAVATKFRQQRPDDPRTKFLEMRVAQEMKRRNPEAYEREITAVVTNMPADIESVDINGKEHKLSDFVGGGHPAILSFAAYSAEQAPAYTMVLRTVYDKYKERGLKIYQVSVDATEPEWHRLAQNLPWTSVWSAAIKQGNPLISYNVDALPMTYIFDAEGNLAERVTDWQTLESDMARYF